MTKISEERMKHMHGVAELMYRNAEMLGIKDKNQMYLLGIVHDIGYIDKDKPHEKLGAEICSSDRLVSHCILWHCSTPSEYKKANVCADADIPKELILLWWADMQIMANGDKAGELVSFDERLNDIAIRHGIQSSAYTSCAEIVEWFRNKGYNDIKG